MKELPVYIGYIETTFRLQMKTRSESKTAPIQPAWVVLLGRANIQYPSHANKCYFSTETFSLHTQHPLCYQNKHVLTKKAANVHIRQKRGLCGPDVPRRLSALPPIIIEILFLTYNK